MEELTIKQPSVKINNFDNRILQIATIFVIVVVAAFMNWANGQEIVITPEVEDFYSDISSKIPVEQNGWYAIWGLTAPEGENIGSYGAQKIQNIKNNPDWSANGELAISFNYDDILKVWLTPKKIRTKRYCHM